MQILGKSFMKPVFFPFDESMNKESANTQTILKLGKVEWFLAQTPLKNKAEFYTTRSAFFIEESSFCFSKEFLWAHYYTLKEVSFSIHWGPSWLQTY